LNEDNNKRVPDFSKPRSIDTSPHQSHLVHERPGFYFKREVERWKY